MVDKLTLYQIRLCTFLHVPSVVSFAFAGKQTAARQPQLTHKPARQTFSEHDCAEHR